MPIITPKKDIYRVKRGGGFGGLGGLDDIIRIVWATKGCKLVSKTISDGMGCKSSIKATEYQTFGLFKRTL